MNKQLVTSLNPRGKEKYRAVSTVQGYQGIQLMFINDQELKLNMKRKYQMEAQMKSPIITKDNSEDACTNPPEPSYTDANDVVESCSSVFVCVVWIKRVEVDA